MAKQGVGMSGKYLLSEQGVAEAACTVERCEIHKTCVVPIGTPCPACSIAKELRDVYDRLRRLDAALLSECEKKKKAQDDLANLVAFLDVSSRVRI